MLRIHRPIRCDFPRGITLCELIIVVLILGLIAGAALPRFASSLAQQQAVTLARQITMDIETARRVARTSSTVKSITFDTVNKTYTLNGVINPNRHDAEYLVTLANAASGASFGTINLGGDAVLIFNGYGIPDSGGTIQVRVGSVTKTVVVDALTGSTTIQ